MLDKMPRDVKTLGPVGTETTSSQVNKGGLSYTYVSFAFSSALHEVHLAMASVNAQEDNSLSPYRKLLVDLSFDLSKKDVETLKLAGVDVIPRRITENIATGLHFFDVLEQDGRIGPRNLDLLQDMLKTVGRLDLARKIQAFLVTSANRGNDGKM